MQENNFEKAVREKLDDLHLTPSEPVWQRVEAAIKKKKERRLVFWLLPLVLLAGGLVWWQWHPWPFEKVSTAQTRQAIQQEKKEAAPTFSYPHTETKVSTPTSKATSTKQTSIENREQPVAVNSSKTVHKATSKKVLVKQHTHRNSVVAAHTPSNIQSINDRIALIELEQRQSTIQATTKNQRWFDSLNESNITDSTNMDTAAAVQKKDSAQAIQPLVHVQATRKWQWRIVSRAGTSNTRENLFALPTAKALSSGYVQSDVAPANQYCGPCALSGSTPLLPVQPATPTKGLQFSFGVVLKKQTGKATAFVTGLQYSYYSTRLLIGKELAYNSGGTNARMFLNNGMQRRFVNQFHMVELPIGLEHRLLKKQPLHLQYGFTVDQLVASRALQFDSRSNLYYQTRTGLRKTTFSLFAAAGYTIWSGKAFSIGAGPHLQYGLSNIFKNTSGTHLFSGGLSGYVSF